VAAEFGKVHIVSNNTGISPGDTTPGIGAYAMTKHGVNALCEALPMELQGAHIGTFVLPGAGRHHAL